LSKEIKEKKYFVAGKKKKLETKFFWACSQFAQKTFTGSLN
jgi:hypothetical protein